MSRITTNALTNGAIMAALVVLFSLLSMLPMVGSIALILAAVPLSIQCVRYNAKSALLAGIAAGILVSIFGGLTGALTAFVQILPLGVAVGIMLKKRRSPVSTFLGAAIIAALGVCLNFIAAAWVMGIPLEQTLDMMFPPFDDFLQIYEETGLLNTFAAQGITLETIRPLYEQMISLFKLLLPVMILFVGIFYGGVHYLLTLNILKRLRIKVRKFPRFDKWYLPAWSAYGLILALIGWVFDDHLPYQWMHALVLNVLAFYSVILFVVGLAVIARWLNIRKQSGGMKVLWCIGVVFIAMSNFALLVSGLGAFDILMDFRHIHPNDQLLPKFLTKNKKPPENSADQPPRKKIKRDK